MAEPWRDTPITFQPQIVCPFCDSPNKLLVRSCAQGDGSVERRYICGSCSRRYRLCIEPADFRQAEWEHPQQWTIAAS
jgi:hypothetical protein